MKFAVCIFDCNDLKKINDRNGHDKGDIYLKETAGIICDVYQYSPVFRIGGDEFAAIPMDRDLQNRDELQRRFDQQCEEKCKHNADPWEKINVARGMAIYDPKEDGSVSDVVAAQIKTCMRTSLTASGGRENRHERWRRVEKTAYFGRRGRGTIGR